MNFDEARAYIQSILWRGSKPGLERQTELMARLGNPQKDLKFIHIAGTNGKGSTAAMLASILKASGHKTGLFTSPHLSVYNERIQISGVNISNEDLAEVTSHIRPFAETMKDKPTEFELFTAIGIEYFKREKCGIVVLETGLGGALDSTNVIDTPELAVITNIGLDHVRELGGTISSIAEAKAGIIKEGGDVVIYGQNPEAEAVFERVCGEKRARLYRPEYDKMVFESYGIAGHRFHYKFLRDLELPLLGAFQRDNASVALKAAEVLNGKGWNISESSLRDGLKNVSWPGRFELLMQDPVFILDGGHNPQCTEAAALGLRELLSDRPIIFLTGVMADKDIEGIFAPLLPLAKEFITVAPDSSGRAMPPERLAEFLSGMGAKAAACSGIIDGVRLAVRKAGREGAVCAIGSLYMAGKIREYVGQITEIKK